VILLIVDANPGVLYPMNTPTPFELFPDTEEFLIVILLRELPVPSISPARIPALPVDTMLTLSRVKL